MGNGFTLKVECDICHRQITAANLGRHKVLCVQGKKCLRESCTNIISGKGIRRRKYCSIECNYLHKIECGDKKRTDLSCVICGNLYTVKRKYKYITYARKTCSQKCLLELIGRNSTENINCGARAGFSRTKRLYYKNILFDSKWEYDLALWLDNHNIIWERSRKIFFRWTDPEGKNRRYTPDFYLSQFDIYLDCKNSYLMKIDAPKIRRVRKKHKIILITGSLKHIKKKIIQCLK